jgi:4-diphosphocytidyl-2-C-methyl-D-erythritol kinase
VSVRSIRVQSPAKINLFLEVLGRRPDGFHEVRTLMQAIDVCDTLVIRKIASGVRLSSHSNGFPLNTSNLSYRAAQLFLQANKIRSGVDIFCTKRIPLAGGLGGGSSNAACTLLGLNRLFRTRWSEERLLETAAKLGSDVPFFVRASLSLAIGKGSDIIPLERRLSFWVVLACPLGPVPPQKTASVYRALKIALTKDPRTFNITLAAIETKSVRDLSKSLFNRLEKVVLRRSPTARQLHRFMQRHGALGTLVSGAGPTVFSMVSGKRQGILLAEKIRGHFGNKVWVRVVRSLAKAPSIQDK